MFSTEVSRDLVRHVATDAVTLKGITAAFLGWFEDPDFDPSLPVLWDCRGQLVDVGWPELADIDQRTVAFTRSRRAPGSRSAILVSTILTKTTLDETISKNVKLVTTFRVFLDEGEALEWLGVPRPGEPRRGG